MTVKHFFTKVKGGILQTNPKKIKVLIVDDKDEIRSGLRDLLDLADDFEIVGESSTGYDAIIKAQALYPDVIIMDVRMPGISGVQACRSILEKVPKTKILMLTTFEEDEILLESLEAGASGYLLKGVSYEELELSLKLVVIGAIQPIDSRIAKNVLKRLRPVLVPEAGHYKFLTALDMEILKGVVAVENENSMRERLGFSTQEYKNHIELLMSRLNVATRDQLDQIAKVIVSNN
ncbi:MAG: response regulator transcription factor [Candidatus Obscuribacterales bacterium]|nr:response regulator transcription factor [Candidatus Obscuribacterales bacterium]